MADHVAGCIVDDARIVGRCALTLCQRQQCRKTRGEKEIVSIEVCYKVAVRCGKSDVAGVMTP